MVAQQFIESPRLDRTPVVKNIDTVGIPNRTQAMGYNEPRYFAPIQAGADDRLGAIIQRAGGLVQKQYFWMHRQGTGDEQSLTLSSGEIGRTFADHGM